MMTGKTRNRQLLLAGAISVLACLADRADAQQSARGTYTIRKDLLPSRGKGVQDERTWVFEVRDASGALRTRVYRSILYDVPAPDAAVLEDGRLFLIHSFDGVAEEFDFSGNLEKRVFLAHPPIPDYERTVRIFPLPREVLLGITSTREEGVEILGLSSGGVIEQKRTIGRGRITGLSADASTGLIAVGLERWRASVLEHEAWFFPDEGEAWSVAAGWTHGLFDTVAHGRFIGWNAAAVFEADLDRKTLVVRRTVSAARVIIDAEIGDEGILLLLSADRPTFDDGTFRYSRAELERVLPSGKTLRILSFDSMQFERATILNDKSGPAVEIDGKKVRED